MPLVSVIIPVYNAAHCIGQTLRSVFAQTFTDYEVIVVNDGSPDTEELEKALSPFLGCIRYIKQENLGLSAARNAGIRASQSPMIGFLDSGGLWEPDYLSIQVAEMMRDPTIDVMYSNARIFGDSYGSGQAFMDLCPSEGEVTFERLVTERCTVMASALIRRAAILDAGMFDEHLRTNEDFDLWLRIVKRGGRIAYHRRILVHYRRRTEKLLSNSVRSCEGILKVLDKVQQTMSLTPSEEMALDQGRAYIHDRLQYYKGKTAFLLGDAKTAIENWKNANKSSRNRKLDLAIGLLQIAPKFLLRVYQLRDRFLYRSSSS
jgi:glycosyltransferase involved in cell wall biosynthesis